MDINMIMRQAQKMQADLKKTQSKLEATIYEGESNGIKIQINGKCECQSITIPEELMDNREMLQDMLLIAFNNAVSKCDEDRENQLGGLTAGLNLPGM